MQQKKQLQGLMQQKKQLQRLMQQKKQLQRLTYATEKAITEADATNINNYRE